MDDNPERREEMFRRKVLPLIEVFVVMPAFLRSFQTGMMQLHAVFPSRFCFQRNQLGSMPTHLRGVIRLRLTAEGRLCTMLAQRLLRVPGQRALPQGLRHATSVVSRRHRFLRPTCVATLEANCAWGVSSVAFHGTGGVLAIGCCKTAKLWRLSSDNSSATCVATLEGHSSFVCSVAFHPTAPLLATGSYDYTAKLWR